MIGSNVRGLYTVTEAARLLGVGRSTMYELVRRGDVSSLRLGRKVLISRSTLEALLGFPPPTPAELAEISPSRPLPLPGRGHDEAPTESGAGRGVNGRARR
ncbi:MAG: helix-turn-helix domain-containing protein [Acidimicrobiales bacterium]